MKIVEIRAMRGPNYWSIRRHKLIVMTLDLEELEERPTNSIPGFLERLKAMFPTMMAHRCSEEREGGFFHRVEEGTWMGHVIEHIALEIAATDSALLTDELPPHAYTDAGFAQFLKLNPSAPSQND